MLVAVAVTGEVLIFLAITLLVDRPRPLVKHLDVAPPTSSFPSGHTAAAVALSRVYRGMHYPTDVLAGALLGTGWLVVTVRGIRLGVRHHELRAETAGENPANPARRWPLPRHG